MQHHYQHILIPVDLSEMGELVLGQAQATAALYSAKLTLVHIMQDIPPNLGLFGDPSGLILTGEMDRKLLAEKAEEVQQFAEKSNLPKESVRVEMGASVTDSILQIAEELKVDLIVIGHSGKKGFFGFMGSTATAVVKSASCDVLVVRR